MKKITTHFPLAPGFVVDVEATINDDKIDEMKITKNGDFIEVDRIAIFPFAGLKPVPAEDLIEQHVMSVYYND